MNTNLNNIVLSPKDKEKLLKNLHYLGLIGTVLSYGMGLKTYANSINRTGNLEKKSDFPTASQRRRCGCSQPAVVVNIINNKMKNIRNFVLLTAPPAAATVIVAFLYLNHMPDSCQAGEFDSQISIELLIGNKINENVASTYSPSLPAMAAGAGGVKFNWIKTIKWLFILLVILGLILKFIFNIDDNLILSLLLNLNTFIGKNIEVLKYLILIWMWGWFFIGIINYIKYKFFYEKTFKKIPKYLPKIFKEEIELFNESSQFPENKEILVAMSRKNLIYIFCFNSFFTCLFLYF